MYFVNQTYMRYRNELCVLLKNVTFPGIKTLRQTVSTHTARDKLIVFQQMDRSRVPLKATKNLPV
jgi:hypothetical protein